MADIDLEGGKEKGSASPSVGSGGHHDYGETEVATASKWENFRDSFKRNPNARVVTEALDEEGRPLPEQPPAEPALSMKLKDRHLQMIAIGGSIGMFHTDTTHNRSH